MALRALFSSNKKQQKESSLKESIRVPHTHTASGDDDCFFCATFSRFDRERQTFTSEISSYVARLEEENRKLKEEREIMHSELKEARERLRNAEMFGWQDDAVAADTIVESINFINQDASNLAVAIKRKMSQGLKYTITRAEAPPGLVDYAGERVREHLELGYRGKEGSLIPVTITAFLLHQALLAFDDWLGNDVIKTHGYLLAHYPQAVAANWRTMASKAVKASSSYENAAEIHARESIEKLVPLLSFLFNVKTEVVEPLIKQVFWNQLGRFWVTVMKSIKQTNEDALTSDFKPFLSPPGAPFDDRSMKLGVGAQIQERNNYVVLCPSGLGLGRITGTATQIAQKAASKPSFHLIQKPEVLLEGMISLESENNNVEQPKPESVENVDQHEPAQAGERAGGAEETNVGVVD